MRLKIQLLELEKDLDRERQKDKEGELEIEDLEKRASEVRAMARKGRENHIQEMEKIKKREEDRVRHVEEEKRRLEVNKEREITKLKEQLERFEPGKRSSRKQRPNRTRAGAGAVMEV